MNLLSLPAESHMIARWEFAANAVNTASILLATLNSSHTWWTGIIGCLLFCWVFIGSQLYADATLQIFFVVSAQDTSARHLLSLCRWTGIPARVDQIATRLAGDARDS